MSSSGRELDLTTMTTTTSGDDKQYASTTAAAAGRSFIGCCVVRGCRVIVDVCGEKKGMLMTMMMMLMMKVSW